MPYDRIQVNDYMALGQKFINWALGTEAKPPTLDAFKTALGAGTAGGIVASVPAYLERLVWAEPVELKTLLLRLPPPELVNDTLAQIGAGGPYRMPPTLFDLYTKMVNGQVGPADNFRFRVGDYSIGLCW